MKLIKKDFAKIISDNLNVDFDKALAVVDNMSDAIIECISRGGSIEVRGLGSLFLRKSNKTVVRNISKNEIMIISPKKRPSFKPSKSFIAKCN